MKNLFILTLLSCSGLMAQGPTNGNAIIASRPTNLTYPGLTYATVEIQAALGLPQPALYKTILNGLGSVSENLQTSDNNNRFGALSSITFVSNDVIVPPASGVEVFTYSQGNAVFMLGLSPVMPVGGVTREGVTVPAGSFAIYLYSFNNGIGLANISSYVSQFSGPAHTIDDFVSWANFYAAQDPDRARYIGTINGGGTLTPAKCPPMFSPLGVGTCRVPFVYAVQ